MYTYNGAISTYKSRWDVAKGRADRANGELDEILAAARAAGRANLTEAEDGRVDKCFATIDSAKAEMSDARAAIDALESAQSEDATADRRAHDVHPTDASKRTASFSVTERPGSSPTADRTGSDLPTWHRSNDGVTATVGRTQRLADHEVTRQMIDRDPGRAITENYSGIGQLVRSLSTGGSSAIVPTIWSANIIDRARNAAVVMQAGAEVVPMDSKVLQVGRLTTDPTPAWLAEGGTRTGSDPAFDSVSLTAKTLTALTVASLEFLQDAVDADTVVEEAIGKAMGLAIDYAALWGGVTTGGEGINQPTPPSPQGILANLLANAATSVLGSGTNGTAITAATPWNELLTTFYTPQTYNEVPNAVLMNAKMQQKYSMTYDSLGQPLRKPDALNSVPWLTTNQIPSFTQGTMANIATDIFAGDFRQVLVGTRMDVTVQVLTERYAELGQVGILSTWRGDVALARPRSMCVYRYIGGM
jgi:HK97 family phage major capsid protein